MRESRSGGLTPILQSPMNADEHLFFLGCRVHKLADNIRVYPRSSAVTLPYRTAG